MHPSNQRAVCMHYVRVHFVCTYQYGSLTSCLQPHMTERRHTIEHTTLTLTLLLLPLTERTTPLHHNTPRHCRHFLCTSDTARNDSIQPGVVPSPPLCFSVRFVCTHICSLTLHRLCDLSVNSA